MKHTPGPWTTSDCETDYYKRGNFWARSVFSLSDAEIRPARAQGETKEYAEANAHLIAAAPDLLEACKAAFNQLKYTNQSTPIMDMDHTKETLKQAISRAEGKEVK